MLVTLSVIAIIAALVIKYYSSIDTKPRAEIVRNKNDKLDYASYVKTATEKGWSPVDPIEKFEISLIRYGTAFSTSKLAMGKIDKTSDFIMKSLVQEFTFLLDVFKATDIVDIDMTYFFFVSIDIAHKCVFRMMKEHLKGE